VPWSIHWFLEKAENIWFECKEHAHDYRRLLPLKIKDYDLSVAAVSGKNNK
jgi:hypothetical protein